MDEAASAMMAGGSWGGHRLEALKRSLQPGYLYPGMVFSLIFLSQYTLYFLVQHYPEDVYFQGVGHPWLQGYRLIFGTLGLVLWVYCQVCIHKNTPVPFFLGDVVQFLFNFTYPFLRCALHQEGAPDPNSVLLLTYVIQFGYPLATQLRTRWVLFFWSLHFVLSIGASIYCEDLPMQMGLSIISCLIAIGCAMVRKNIEHLFQTTLAESESLDLRVSSQESALLGIRAHEEELTQLLQSMDMEGWSKLLDDYAKKAEAIGDTKIKQKALAYHAHARKSLLDVQKIWEEGVHDMKVGNAP